jgi:hypothetical protein
VVAPAAVEHLQHHATLELAHRGLAELLLARAYAIFASERISRLSTSGVTRPCCRSRRRPRRSSRHRVQRLQLGPQGVEVPALGVARRCGRR